jgi:hypothetical protein
MQALDRLENEMMPYFPCGELVNKSEAKAS